MANLTSRITVSCNAPYGKGGLGQHLAQVLSEAINAGHQCTYYCAKPATTVHEGHGVELLQPKLLRYTPLRYSPGWINFSSVDCFDRAVARKLPPAQIFEGFVGQSLSTFKRARQLGYGKLHLQAANSHVDNVISQHQKAIQRFGLEESWLNEAQQHKTLEEYKMADVIFVASEYSRQTMLAAGIPDHKLQRIELTVNPRYQPTATRKQDDTFRIVYVGSLTVMKGIPVLLEAFSRLPDKNIELTLVGGYATRGMRRCIQGWLAKDPRIKLAPGDPLPHLQNANLYVHPTYEDGFAYAPMEALACGVPVVVTEDTGMKEHIQEGINGYIVPTGSVDALVERLMSLQKKELVM